MFLNAKAEIYQCGAPHPLEAVVPLPGAAELRDSLASYECHLVTSK
jgi:hypothetical protein